MLTDHNAVNRVRALSQARGSTKWVLVALSFYMDENDTASLTIEALIRETGLNRHTVYAAIARLEALGELRVVREHRKPNSYTLLLPTITYKAV